MNEEFQSFERVIVAGKYSGTIIEFYGKRNVVDIVFDNVRTIVTLPNFQLFKPSKEELLKLKLGFILVDGEWVNV